LLSTASTCSSSQLLSFMFLSSRRLSTFTGTLAMEPPQFRIRIQSLPLPYDPTPHSVIRSNVRSSSMIARETEKPCVPQNRRPARNHVIRGQARHLVSPRNWKVIPYQRLNDSGGHSTDFASLVWVQQTICKHTCRFTIIAVLANQTSTNSLYRLLTTPHYSLVVIALLAEELKSVTRSAVPVELVRWLLHPAPTAHLRCL
jgi:hypothetical protein